MTDVRPIFICTVAVRKKRTNNGAAQRTYFPIILAKQYPQRSPYTLATVHIRGRP